jgi:GT2 family glycosyltransferase
MSQRQTVVVGIATAGRREQLTRTLRQLAQQHRLPDRLFVCPASQNDYDDSYEPARGPPVELVTAKRGLCSQRNAILTAASDADLIVFFDDDFYPAPDYLERLLALFEEMPDVVGATARPGHDGASSAGLSHEFALDALARLPPLPAGHNFVRTTYGGYGCNMTFRLDPIRRHALRFDESLPLYGWLEDIDFSQRIAKHGRIVNDARLRGVHLGTKAGRTSGVRLGYSQVANPIYMTRKGSMNFCYAAKHVAKNVASNVGKSLRPEPWVDRRGRLKGNAFALQDLILGRLHPQRCLELR